MEDSRNKPEIETLGYKPGNKIEKHPYPEPPKPLKRGFMGLNAHVTKPAARVNKTEDAEPPNQNLMIIEEIEGLISQANEKMYDLPIHPARSQAIEEIDIFLRITVNPCIILLQVE